MSEFKFGCPGCHQHISVTEDYVGHQINCPSCKALITVPPAPQSAAAARSSIATPLPPGMPPPPAPPAATKLGVAALSAPHQTSAPPAAAPDEGGSAQFKAHMARKPKKSYAGVIAGVTAVVLIGIAAYLNRDRLSNQWHSWRGTPVAVVETNAPPPPPPELTVDEVWQKVASTYKELKSYSAAGSAVAVLDYTEVNKALAANGPRTTTAALSLKMSRPDNFRLDLVEAKGTSNSTAVGWSAGKGEFTRFNSSPDGKAASAFQVFSRLNATGTGLGAAFVSALYSYQGEGGPIGGEGWTREEDQTVNGKPCYVLTGALFMRDAKVLVERGTFLITSIQLALDGKVMDDSLDDAKIKSALTTSGLGQVTAADITQFKRNLKAQSKLKGALVETFTTTTANPALALTDFEPAATAVAAAPAPGNSMPGRGIGGSGPGGVPGRMRRGGGPGGPGGPGGE